MKTVTFRATATVPQWVHRKGGKQLSDHEGAPGGQTWRLVPPDILSDGDWREMDDFDTQWCLAHLPGNFTVAD